jgi:hypothetical protein
MRSSLERIKQSTQLPGEKKMTTTATTTRGIMITDFTTLYGMVMGD